MSSTRPRIETSAPPTTRRVANRGDGSAGGMKRQHNRTRRGTEVAAFVERPPSPYNCRMLPAAYTTPAAVVLVVGGLLSCFAGYRLFRVVLGLYGFILGAAITTSI